MVQVHPWTSIYVWKTTPLYNQFGETVGRLDANTIYLNQYSPCPEEDLFHELGHAVARKFDLIAIVATGFWVTGSCASFDRLGAYAISGIGADCLIVLGLVHPLAHQISLARSGPSYLCAGICIPHAKKSPLSSRKWRNWNQNL
jgi:hypothetical protein